MNTQKPSPLTATSCIEVHSIFKTIQGEGPFAGEPAVFIRLSGCNLQCPLCDTDYTSKIAPLNPATVVAIVTEIAGTTKLVVITGGEPFRQQSLERLVQLLINNDFHVQIETNGTLYRVLPYGESKLTIVCSPKTPKINALLAAQCKHFKYVATAESLAEDGLPNYALGLNNQNGQLYRPQGIGRPIYIYLQPVDEKDDVKNKQNQVAVVESCLKNGYTLCLQLHKIIGVE